eukprot:11162137-Lingulodinium_polyedra.AAC.1
MLPVYNGLPLAILRARKHRPARKVGVMERQKTGWGNTAKLRPLERTAPLEQWVPTGPLARKTNHS